MTDAAGVVGPVPAGADAQAYDRLRRRVLWSMPSGLYLVGSRAGDRLNLMTLNWATQVAFEPKLLAISVEREALTHELISRGKVFSLCVLDREDRAVVRKFAKPAELDADRRTLSGFAFRSASTGAPILAKCLAYVDCEVRQEVQVGDHTLFVGEVADAGFPHGEGGQALRMEDTRMSYGG